MQDPSQSLLERASLYAASRSIQLKQQLGFGKDGSVYSTSKATAVKVFRLQEMFSREWACYARLSELGIFEILGHWVPQLRGADDRLLVIEMSIVERPFLLDFASAYLDDPPDFPPDVIQQWEESKQEEFGPHWPRVVTLLELLKQDFGIYLLDVHPGNIAFVEPE